jgi:hypothetical protein
MTDPNPASMTDPNPAFHLPIDPRLRSVALSAPEMRIGHTVIRAISLG